MSAAPQVRCVVECRNVLGEGPVWDDVARVLWWIDIAKPALQRLDPATGKVDAWTLPGTVGAFVLRRDGGFLFAFRHGLAFVDAPGAEPRPIPAPGARLDAGRFNDGKCDRAGRFWVGTLDRKLKEPVGELYRIGPDLSVTTVDRGFTISNGMAWSPDGRTMYFADTPSRTIFAYDFDAATGAATGRRMFVRFDDRPGRPDGCTIDAEGFLWSARVDGGCIDRYAPDGRLDRSLALPVTKPTCCAFGGPDLATLYITTATLGIAPDLLAAQPLAGSLFAAEVGVRGIPEVRFAG